MTSSSWAGSSGLAIGEGASSILRAEAKLVLPISGLEAPDFLI